MGKELGFCQVVKSTLAIGWTTKSMERECSCTRMERNTKVISRNGRDMERERCISRMGANTQGIERMIHVKVMVLYHVRMALTTRADLRRTSHSKREKAQLCIRMDQNM